MVLKLKSRAKEHHIELYRVLRRNESQILLDHFISHSIPLKEPFY